MFDQWGQDDDDQPLEEHVECFTLAKMSRSPKWRTAHGDVLNVSDMSPTHLENAIAFVQRNLERTDINIKLIAGKIAQDPVQPDSTYSALASYRVEQISHTKSLVMLNAEQDNRDARSESDLIEVDRLKLLRTPKGSKG